MCIRDRCVTTRIILLTWPSQIGIWSDFLAELKDAAGAFGTPAYTAIPGQVMLS